MAELTDRTEEHRITWALRLTGAPELDFDNASASPSDATVTQVTDEHGTRHEIVLTAPHAQHGDLEGVWSSPRAPWTIDGLFAASGNIRSLPTELIADISSACTGLTPFDLDPELSFEVIRHAEEAYRQFWQLAITGGPLITFPNGDTAFAEIALVEAAHDGTETSRVLVDLVGDVGAHTRATSGRWTAGREPEDYYPGYAGPIADLPHPFVAELLVACGELTLPEPKEPTS